MNILTKLFTFHKHDWKQKDGSFPVYGYWDTPYPDSYCACGKTGADV